MTKKFTRLQLFSLTDGRLSTKTEDLYDMLNHIFNTDATTIGLAMLYSRLLALNPEWFKKEREELNKLSQAEFGKDAKDVPFEDIESYIRNEVNIDIDVPQIDSVVNPQNN